MSYMWIAAFGDPADPLTLSTCLKCGAVVPVQAQGLHDQFHANWENNRQ